MHLSSVKIARAWKQAQCLLIVNWLSQFMAHPLIKYRAAIKREDSLSDVEDLQGILSKKKKLQNNVNVVLKVHIYYLYAYILYTYKISLEGYTRTW